MSLMGILDRVADKATFDKAIGPAQRAVQAVLKPQAFKDLLHGTWLGHPLHPVLVQVPVGSWASAGLLDAIPPLRPAATVLIGTGVTVAVPAAMAGAAGRSEADAGERGWTPSSAPARTCPGRCTRAPWRTSAATPAWSARGTARRSTWRTGGRAAGRPPTRRRSWRCAWT